MDHPRPWMKFVDVKDLDAEAKFGEMEVLSSDGEKLGRLDGFIIDETSARPYHVVVSAGHWFTHKHFLVPIWTRLGERLDADRGSAVQNGPKASRDSTVRSSSGCPPQI